MFKHFENAAQIAAFIEMEVLDSLYADLERMEETEEDYYTDEDRDEVRNKIADIKAYLARAAA
jgi:hypothetical protein